MRCSPKAKTRRLLRVLFLRLGPVSADPGQTGRYAAVTPHRFPPPWSVKKVDIGAQDDGDMLALSDSQLRALWEAAASLPIEKRGIFLLRLVAQLQFRSSNFTTADLDDAVRLALKGLIQKSAA